MRVATGAWVFDFVTNDGELIACDLPFTPVHQGAVVAFPDDERTFCVEDVQLLEGRVRVILAPVDW